MDSLTAEESACVLAAFLREGGSTSEVRLSDSTLSRSALDVLRWIDAKAGELETDEGGAGVIAPTGFWSLSALWVCITERWLAGDSLTRIAADFDLFEGNIQRGLMRIGNLLEEWAAIAELRRDLGTLEKIRGLRFLRDEIVVDSLYLRL
jgi:hypothetical protein